MTEKETIFAQIIDTRNETDRINGKELPKAQVKDVAKDNEYIESHTLEQLKDELELATTVLSAAKRKATAAEYYKTEAGIAFKNQRGEQIDRLTQESEEARKKFVEKLSAFVKKHLGNGWKIGTLNDRNVTFQCLKSDGCPDYGMTLDVILQDEGLKFELPYIHAVYPAKDDIKVRLIKGVTILSATDVAQELEKTLMEYVEYISVRKTAISEYTQQLLNPTAHV